MPKFLELLRASIGRERQWADTRLELTEPGLRTNKVVRRGPAAPLSTGFPPTVPMTLGAVEARRSAAGSSRA